MYILNTGSTQGDYDRRYPDGLSEIRTGVHELGSGMTTGLQARQPSSHAGMALSDKEINLPKILI